MFRANHRTNHRICSQRGFQRFRLEPLVENFAGRCHQKIPKLSCIFTQRQCCNIRKWSIKIQCIITFSIIIIHPLGYKRVYLPLDKVADTPFRIKGVAKISALCQPHVPGQPLMGLSKGVIFHYCFNLVITL